MKKVSSAIERGGQTPSKAGPRPAPLSGNGQGTPRPRILLLADKRAWAYDTAAQAISKRLADEFEFRIEYVREAPDLSAWPFDLIYVFFWGETYHHRFVSDPRRVIKEISSHRWALEEEYGKLSPAQAAERYLSDAATLTATSRRLQLMFSPHREVHLTPNGFEPSDFLSHPRRPGPPRLGWAGNEQDRCKGLQDILRPAAGRDFELNIAGGALGPREMGQFYNNIDVLCVASTAEGEPLTLVEAMACGCFPVSVDVGIVPELVQHGTNGLIVQRNIAAFQAAFQWCRLNADCVRDAGQRNAQALLQTRTWDQVSGCWRRALRGALAKLSPVGANGVQRAARVAVSQAPASMTLAGNGAPALPPLKTLALFSAAVNGDNSGDALIVDATQRLLGQHPAKVFPLLQPLTAEQVEEVNGCDAAIICGTNLYQHIFSCALTAEVIAKIKIPILPLGLGGSAPIGQLPHMDEAGVQAVRMLHDRCAVGSVRDLMSLEFLRRLGIKNVELTGCPVLFHALREPQFAPANVSRLFLSIRARLLHIDQSWGAKALRTLEALAGQFKPTLLLQSPYDLPIALELAKRFGLDLVHDETYCHTGMVQAARDASRTVGFRLHFGMVSLSYGKPAAIIATDTRTTGFCDMMGLPYYDLRTYTDETLTHDLLAPPPDMTRFGQNWRGLRAAMIAVLEKNGLVSELAASVAPPDPG